MSGIEPETPGAPGIFPNPVRSGVAMLRWDMAPLGAANAGRAPSVRIYDAAGRCVLHATFGSGASSLPLDLGSLRDGVYLVRLAGGEGTSTQKLVVQR